MLYRIAVGTIDVNIWADWENTFIQSFTIHSPYSPPFVLHVAHHSVFRKQETPIKHPITFAPLEVHRYHVASVDGTRVPFVCIRQKGVTPKAQFIYVYGSYGSTTPVNWPYQQWYPLLQRKWVIVFAMVRGGGDVDAAWADAARREHRHVTIDDFEAVIRGSQKRHRLGPAQTVIYGRSAGGVPVGAIVSRYPHGQLVGYGSNVVGDISLTFRPLLFNSIGFKFFLVYDLLPADRTWCVNRLNQLLAEGKLQHTIGARFPLDQIVKAHEAVEAGQLGNVVIDL
jgi:hypothetical protein